MCESGYMQVCLDMCVSLYIGCVNSSICIHVAAYIFDRVLDTCVCVQGVCIERRIIATRYIRKPNSHILQ